MDLGGSMNTKVATVILPSSAYFLQKCEFCNRLTEVWGKPWHCQQLSQINNAIDTLCWSILLVMPSLPSPKGSIINLCPPISINHTLLSCFDVLKGRRFVWQQSYTPSLAPSVQGKIRKGGGRLPSSIVDDESGYQSVLCFVRERCWVKKGRLAEAHLTVWR